MRFGATPQGHLFINMLPLKCFGTHRFANYRTSHNAVDATGGGTFVILYEGMKIFLDGTIDLFSGSSMGNWCYRIGKGRNIALRRMFRKMLGGESPTHGSGGSWMSYVLEDSSPRGNSRVPTLGPHHRQGVVVQIS
jgi:hypothetical protein